MPIIVKMDPKIKQNNGFIVPDWEVVPLANGSRGSCVNIDKVKPKTVRMNALAKSGLIPNSTSVIPTIVTKIPVHILVKGSTKLACFGCEACASHLD